MLHVRMLNMMGDNAVFILFPVSFSLSVWMCVRLCGSVCVKYRKGQWQNGSNFLLKYFSMKNQNHLNVIKMENRQRKRNRESSIKTIYGLTLFESICVFFFFFIFFLGFFCLNISRVLMIMMGNNKYNRRGLLLFCMHPVDQGTSGIFLSNKIWGFGIFCCSKISQFTKRYQIYKIRRVSLIF